MEWLLTLLVLTFVTPGVLATPYNLDLQINGNVHTQDLTLQSTYGGETHVFTGLGNSATFPTGFAESAAYNVSLVNPHPNGQVCTVSNGEDVMGASGAHTQIVVECVVECPTEPTVAGSDSLLCSNRGESESCTKNQCSTEYTASGTGVYSCGADSLWTSGDPLVCAINTYELEVVVSGNTEPLLFVNGADPSETMTIGAQDGTTGSANFSTALNYNEIYSVGVQGNEPLGQTCMGTGKMGSMASGGATVEFTCSVTTLSIQATLTGLGGEWVSVNLQDGDTSQVLTTYNWTSEAQISFPNQIIWDTNLTVSIETSNDAKLSCTTNYDAGFNIRQSISDFAVSCVIRTYTIGGNIYDMTGTISLTNNNGDLISNHGANTFQFGTELAYGSSYSVLLTQQSNGQDCYVTDGTGSVFGAITNVNATCVDRMCPSSVPDSGVTSPLDAKVVSNVCNDMAVGDTCSLACDTGYHVTTLSSNMHSCNANGEWQCGVGGCLVCSPDAHQVDLSFTGPQPINGSVVVVLNDDTSNQISVTTLPSSSPIIFGNNVYYDGNWALTIPAAPYYQICSVDGGISSGVVSMDISKTITCVWQTFKVRGTITGISGTLILTNNGGDDLEITGNLNNPEAFEFSTPLSYNSNYNVGVKTNPIGQTCVVQAIAAGSYAANPGQIDGTMNVHVDCTSSIGNKNSNGVFPKVVKTAFTVQGVTSINFEAKKIAIHISFADAVFTGEGGTTNKTQLEANVALKLASRRTRRNLVDAEIEATILESDDLKAEALFAIVTHANFTTDLDNSLQTNGETLGIAPTVSDTVIETIEYSALPNECKVGNYTTSGLVSGPVVQLLNDDPNDTAITKDSTSGQLATYLNLDVLVPTKFWFNEPQNYFALTFHDRAVSDSELQTSGCFTTRTDNYKHCPNNGVSQYWKHSDYSDDRCLQLLQGKIPWNSLMQQDWADQNRISIQEINYNYTQGGVGVGENFTVSAWQVFFAADFEVWTNITTQGSADHRAQFITNNQPYSNSLTLDIEFEQKYNMLFWVEFPKYIEVKARIARTLSRLITLYAIVRVQQVETNFNYDHTGSADRFGHITFVLETQTQHPFVLRGPQDVYEKLRPIIHETSKNPNILPSPDASFRTNYFGYPPPGGSTINTTHHDAFRKAIDFVQDDNGAFPGNDSCTSTDSEYCVQRWKIKIVPKVCDISGQYRIQFWGACYDQNFTYEQGNCALDTIAIRGSDYTRFIQSNTWTGVLDFSIQSQPFCPKLLDVITIGGRIQQYTDVGYNNAIMTEQSLYYPATGSNPVYSNDHSWYRARFHTTSNPTISNLTNDVDRGNLIPPCPLDTDGVDPPANCQKYNDLLIKAVRPTAIKMHVEMQQKPWQWPINNDHNDVAGLEEPNSLTYTVTLCEATKYTFPYNNPPDQSNCFPRDSNKYNSGLMAFEKVEAINGVNVPDNQIAWFMRLDERVIPIDAANSAVKLTIIIDVEAYYTGDFENPSHIGRRSLRRNLQTIPFPEKKQDLKVYGSPFVVRYKPKDLRPNCPNARESTTHYYRVEASYRSEQIPSTEKGVAFGVDFKYKLTKDLRMKYSDVTVRKIETCSESKKECVTIFRQAQTALQLARKTKVHSLVRYYLEFKSHMDYLDFENRLQELSAFEGAALSKVEAAACRKELHDNFDSMNTEDLDNFQLEDDSVQSFTLMLLVVAFLALL